MSEKDDGGVDRPTCPVCDASDDVYERPEAGYWTCERCLERGSGPADNVNWWRNDPDSMWYTEDADA